MASYVKLGRKKRFERYLFPIICLSVVMLLVFASILRSLPVNNVYCDKYEHEHEQVQVSEPKTVMTSMTALSGGLGNNLFEIISLLGIANTLNRTATVNVLKDNHVSALSKIYYKLPNLVGNFEFKLIPENLILEKENNNAACCRFDDPKKFLNLNDTNLRLKGSYYQSYKYFAHLRDQVRDWLQPNSNDTETAKKLIDTHNQKLKNFKLCVHNRRGDFKTDGVHEPTHPAFSRLATDFLVSKYKTADKNVTVVLMSNDVDFSKAVFQDKLEDKSPASNKTIEYKQRLVITYPSNSPDYSSVTISKTSPSTDLAFSRLYCDSVLITAPSSTFGWWLGYLAKPEAKVYYRNIDETEDDVKKQMNQEDFYPPEWIRLGANSKGDIVESQPFLKT